MIFTESKFILKLLSAVLIILGFMFGYFVTYVISPDKHIESLYNLILVRFSQFIIILIGLFIGTYTFKSLRKIRVLLISIFFFFSLLFILEVISYMLISKDTDKNKIVGKPHYGLDENGKLIDNVTELDEFLGFKPKSNISIIHNITPDYSYTASTDSFGRRTFNKKIIPDNQDFAIFFGGSFVWGYVNDDKTIPYLFSRCHKNYNSYNYGFWGYGPQQMFSRLDNLNLKSEITENNGIAIYIIIPDHVSRLIGSMRVSATFGNYFPFYKIEYGKIVYKGNFHNDRELLTTLYVFLKKSHFITLLNLEIPKMNEDHVYFTSKIIFESKNRFHEVFGNVNQFYVLLFPAKNDKEIAVYELLIKHLNAMNIDYFDYSTRLNRSDRGYSIPGDNHPTALLNKIISEKLCLDI